MRSNQIVKSLHKILRNDDFVIGISDSIGNAFDELDAKVAEYHDQHNLDIATWAVPIYEKELGLGANVNKSIIDRRSAIKAKLRGTGKIGIKEIQLVANSWSNGEIEVLFVNGQIQITFSSLIGVPSYLDELKLAINELAPAHLAVIYNIIYNQYQQLRKYTHQSLRQYTHEQLRSSQSI